MTGSASIANGTNRIAILLQTAVGVAAFQTGKMVPYKIALRLVPPAVLGGLGGAWLATSLDPSSMRLALSIAVVFVALTAVLRPPATPPLRGVWALLAFFLVGVYIGFLHVGVGFLLLACLVGGLGLDLVRANAAKLLIVLLTTLPVLFIFGWKGQLRIAEGLVLSVGNMSGAWIAARLAIRRGAGWVRIVVCVAAVLAIVKLLLFPS